MDYNHEHDHGDMEHAHPHMHSHDHGGHTHHDHTCGEAQDNGKILALLQYMLEHNVHHCGELKELAGELSGEARHQLLHAVERFDEANRYLAQVIEELNQ